MAADEESIEESSASSSDNWGKNNDGALKPVAANTPMEIFAGAIAGVSVATSVAAMVLSPGNVVFAAGALSR